MGRGVFQSVIESAVPIDEVRALDAVEVVARVLSDRRVLVPPSEADFEHIRSIERDVITGAMARGIESEEEDSALAEAFVRMSAYPGRPQEGVDPGTERLGRGRWGLRVPDDVALHFKELETIHEEAGLPGTFVQYMCKSFFETWGPHLDT